MRNSYLLIVCCAFSLLARGPAAHAQGKVVVSGTPLLESARTQAGATTWSNPASWASGAVPGSGAVVAVDHTLALDQDATVASLTVGSGATFLASDATPRTLSFNPGGTLTITAGAECGAGAGTLAFGAGAAFRNSGTFGAGTGTVTFSGTAVVGGSQNTAFRRVTVSGGGVDFGETTTSTIISELRLEANGFVGANPPAYAPGATLTYASGTGVGAPQQRALEWSSLSGKGYPANVRLANNTWLDLSGGTSNTPRALAGDLLIDAGAGLTLGSDSAALTQPLTVLGSVIVDGTLELSEAPGGDLRFGGDLTVNGAVVPNGRTVAFIGSAAQAVQSGVPLTLDYLALDKTGGQVSLLAPLTVSAPAGGTPINFFAQPTTTGLNIFNLNGQTLTLGTAGVVSMAGSFAPGSAFTDDGTGTLVVRGEGSFGTLRFAAGTSLGTLTLDRTGPDAGATLGTALHLTTALNLMQTHARLTLGPDNLVLAPGASITGADAGRYVVTESTGALAREGMGTGGLTTPQLFPVGTADAYNPATLTNSGALDTYEVRVSAASAYSPPYPTRQLERFWTVNEATPGGSNATLRLQWMGTGPQEQEGADFVRENTLVFTRNDGAGYAKAGAILVQLADPFAAEAFGLTAFGEWSVGNDNVLPVTLYYFTGRMSGPDALLAWQTASERNCQLFDVERSVDGRRYERIGTLPGAGTTQEPRSYRFTDAGVAQLGATVLYYRLRQLDDSGNSTFSNTISMAPGQTTGSEPVIFPNQLTGNDFTLRCFAAAAETAELTITDAAGHLAYHSQVALGGGYNYIASRDLPGYVGLVPGMYAAHLTLPAQRPVQLRLLRY